VVWRLLTVETVFGAVAELDSDKAV
jgi:hypothetical protein